MDKQDLLIESFISWDTDCNGTISRVEFKEMLMALDPKEWRERRVDQVMNLCDVNADGEIDYVEFVNWLFGAATWTNVPEPDSFNSAMEKAPSRLRHVLEHQKMVADRAAKDAVGKLAVLPMKEPKHSIVDVCHTVLILIADNSMRDPLTGNLRKGLTWQFMKKWLSNRKIAAQCLSDLSNHIVEGKVSPVLFELAHNYMRSCKTHFNDRLEMRELAESAESSQDMTSCLLAWVLEVVELQRIVTRAVLSEHELQEIMTSMEQGPAIKPTGNLLQQPSLTKKTRSMSFRCTSGRLSEADYLSNVHLKDLSGLTKVHPKVEQTCAIVMHLLTGVLPSIPMLVGDKIPDVSWTSMKEILKHPDTLKASLITCRSQIDSGSAPQENLNNAHELVEKMGPDFDVALLSLKSFGAAGLCSWTLDCLAANKAQKEAWNAEKLSRRYSEPDFIFKILEKGDVALVWDSYFQEVATANKTLAKRQSLPAHAIADVETLKKIVAGDPEKAFLPIISISYCWGYPGNPDPDGEVARLIARLLTLLKDRFRDTSFGMFMDWCCIYQKPWTPGRESEEEKAFLRSLSYIDLWYMHQRTLKWLLTAPTRVMLRTGALPYEQRGWPTFERAVSQLITESKLVLDIGLVADQLDEAVESTHLNWVQVRDMCALTREPTIAPSSFQAILDDKKFTEGSDTQFVTQKYREVFNEVMGSVRTLELSRLQWDDDAIEKLSEALPACLVLKELELWGNRITDEGACKLAMHLESCQKLEYLDLRDNYIGEDGQQDLLQNWILAGKTKSNLKMAPQQDISALDDSVCTSASMKRVRAAHGL